MKVFTTNSLRAFLEIGRSVAFEPFQADTDYGVDLVAVDVDGQCFLCHRADDSNSNLVMVDEAAWEAAQVHTPSRSEDMLRRIDRVAWEMCHPPISLPWSWSKYSYANLVAFFAFPRFLNPDSSRWIAEALPQGDACFWRLTDRSDQLRLENFEPDRSRIGQVRSLFPQAIAKCKELFPEQPVAAAQLLQPTIDLGKVSFGSVVGTETFTTWRRMLTSEQRRVLDLATMPIKIRGAAGTGKTLVMMLKALNELYADLDRRETSNSAGNDTEQNRARILFVTHSWAMADQVAEGLQLLDERDVASTLIDVMPLTFLREYIQGQQADTEVFGEDSLDGKQRQLDLISRAIDDVIATTWSSYEDDVSPWVRIGAQDGPGTHARKRLCWSLMREFTEVIDANRLKPGINAMRRYIGIDRAGWMVPLDTKGDREFAFGIYSSYVEYLVTKQQLTIDQAVSDFRGFLESYVWNLRRRDRGYDLIFVDEFHLFNDTERLIIHLLTSESEEYPKIILAMDPYQSPFAYVTGLKEDELSHAAKEIIGNPKHLPIVDFMKSYRFGPRILAFVRHIHDRVPNLVDVGHDWQYAISDDSNSTGDELPVIHFISKDDVISEALGIAKRLNRGGGRDEKDRRVALVGIGNSDLMDVAAYLAGNPESKANFEVVKSRDDYYQLNYSRKAIVVTSALYAAGLQFSDVVVVSTSADSPEFGPAGTGAHKATLTYLYLAITRARNTLHIVCPTDDGVLAETLKVPVNEGLARLE